MPFVCISSFYSGRTYRLEIPAFSSASVAAPSSPINDQHGGGAAAGYSNSGSVSIQQKGAASAAASSDPAAAASPTYGMIISQLRSLWRVQGQPPPTMDLLLTCLEQSQQSSYPPKTPPAADEQQQLQQARSASADSQATPRNSNNNTTSSTGNNSFVANNQLVAGSDPIHPALLHSTENANVSGGCSSSAHGISSAHLFLLYKHAHRDNIERLLLERTAAHPQDLSPSPTATHVERGMTALLSVFTSLSAKVRLEIEGILAAIDATRARADEYAVTLKQDVERAAQLRDGEVAREISVSVESLSRQVAEVKAALGRATAIVSEFNLPAMMTSSSTATAALITAASSGKEPEKCYDAAANARRELNTWAKKLASANEIVKSVHEQFFPRFESLRALPEAYPAAEELAVRRVHLYQACARVQNQLAAEAFAIQEKIAAFVQKYGSKFPQNLLRGLDAPVPMLHVAYEPLLRSGSVPVSPGGPSELLKRLGLLPGLPNVPSSVMLHSMVGASSSDNISGMMAINNNHNNNNNNNNNSHSSLGHSHSQQQQQQKTQPPTPIREGSEEQQQQQQQQEHHAQSVAAAAAEQEARTASAVAVAQALAAEAAKEEAAREFAAERTKLAEQRDADEKSRWRMLDEEADARRTVEMEHFESRLALLLQRESTKPVPFPRDGDDGQTAISVGSAAAVAPLPSDDDDTDYAAAIAAASSSSTSKTTSSSAFADQNSSNSSGKKGITVSLMGSDGEKRKAVATTPNFLRSGSNEISGSAATTTTTTASASTSTSKMPLLDKQFLAQYSRALNYNLSDALAVWAVEEDTSGGARDRVRLQLCEILSPAILNFERPTIRRPAFAFALGGALRVLWASGDTAPSEMSRGTVSGRVVLVTKLEVLNGSGVPLAEVSCQVARV